MSLLKSGFVIAAISGLILLPPAALPQVTCFGLNCPDEEDYLSRQPGQPGGFSTWHDYATWRGLNAGLHYPNDMPMEACFAHCGEHARNAQNACIQLTDGAGANNSCTDIFWTILNTCYNQCQDNPHGSDGVFQ